ncbi:MAG: hypothetical protein WAX69_16895 [Victivallales bacterium]
MILLNSIADAKFIFELNKKYPGRRWDFMISYNSMRKNRNITYIKSLIEQGLTRNVYLDSGAYSVFYAGSTVTLPEYRYFLDMFGRLFTMVFSYDSDFNDPEENCRAHFNLVNDLGFVRDSATGKYVNRGANGMKEPPIPAIHSIENAYKEFVEYVESGFDYIGIGVKYRDKGMAKIYMKEWPKIDKYRREHKVKIHLLGKISLLEDFYLEMQPDTADSTYYSIACQQGDILYLGDEYKIDKKTKIKTKTGSKRLYKVYLEERRTPMPKKYTISSFKDTPEGDGFEKHLKDVYKFKASDLIGNDNNKSILNFCSLLEFQEYLTNKAAPAQAIITP